MLSILAVTASICLIAGVIVIGFAFFWYLLLLMLVVAGLRKLYVIYLKRQFKQRNSSGSAQVEVGDFSKGPGRIIDHDL